MKPETESREYTTQIEALNKLLADHNKHQSTTINRLNKTLVVVSICFTCIIVAMVSGFFWYEVQFETVESTTTELTTEGDDADINSVTNGDMYNDNSIHNE